MASAQTRSVVVNPGVSVKPRSSSREKGTMAASLPRAIAFDDSVRAAHRSPQDPSSPRCEVVHPGTPQDASLDVFACWTELLPRIRVVGRGFEARRHGGCAALQMLQAVRESKASGSGSAGSGATPFRGYAMEQPHFEDAALAPAPGVGSKAAATAALPAAAAKRPARPLVTLDSASSMDMMGASGHRVSFGSAASACTSPCTPLLEALVGAGAGADGDDDGCPNTPPAAWPSVAVPAAAPMAVPTRSTLDISRRVHGSSSFSDLCAAALAEVPEAVAQFSPRATATCRKLTMAGSCQRLARLDSGPLGGVLGIEQP